MMMKPHWIMVPITMMLINGCVSQDYLDHKANADGIQDTMEQARADNTAALGNVQYLTKPPALPVPIKNDESPAWLQQEVRLKAEHLPLSMVLSMLLEGSDVDVSFDPDVNPNTPIGLLTISSQPARISQTVKTPYLSDISTEVTDTTTSTSTTRGNVVEGIDMMVNANVKDDFVWIRTAGKLTKIAGDSTEVIDDATLRFISTRSADLSFTNKLRYGQTVVIGSVKQQTQTANKSSSFGWDGLGSQVSGQETVETLMQAARRSWRIGQQEDVDVTFLGYQDSAQMACLELMAKKIAVTQSTSGDMPDNGLDVLNSDGDNVEVALAKSLLQQTRR